MMRYGVRWREFTKSFDIVIKDKFFETEEQMEKFERRLVLKDNFIDIIGHYF